MVSQVVDEFVGGIRAFHGVPGGLHSHRMGCGSGFSEVILGRNSVDGWIVYINGNEQIIWKLPFVCTPVKG